jgi:NADPH:quinone reductase-like Zn-dependent oxidoreductase
MKAAVRERYGPPEVVEVREIERPVPGEDEVLVRVRAASLNRADYYGLTGTPLVARPSTGFFKPKEKRLGIDYAGEVEAVGASVTEFRPGDAVFGGRNGSFAEYVVARADRGIALKPANVTFDEAAAAPVAALTALQGLRDKANLRPGQAVLINGASGGVGTLAVQVAKALGAEVTAVCSTRNIEMVQSLGADHVVDYTREDFTRSGRRYDVLFDVAGSRSWSECKRVLAPQATFVVVGGPNRSRLLGPISTMVKLRVGSIGSSQNVAVFIAKINKAGMAVLRELLEDGKVKPVVERRYELGDVAQALAYMGEGHARAKVVITP